MYVRIIILFLGVNFLFACSSDNLQIRAVCDNDSPVSYALKWELFPKRTGTVKIFESGNPDSFDNAVLVAEKPISEGFALIPRSDRQRHFFLLSFDKKHSTVVGERHIITERVDNLRDLGGYYQGKTRQVKWGKLFRSGTLSWLSQNDRITLDSLHIHTIIDLRSLDNIQQYPGLYKVPSIINVHLHDLYADSVRNKIIGGKMKKGDVMVALQDMYAQIIDKDTAQLEDIFNILLEEEQYPILFHCALGKDRAGLLTVLILEALGIDREQIYADYMLSNSYINFNRAVVQAPDLGVEMQEALTTLLSANEPLFNFIYEKIEMNYGSVDKYLEKKIHLTSKKREKLQQILLY